MIISITIFSNASFLRIRLRHHLANYAMPHKTMIPTTPIPKKQFSPFFSIASAIANATPVPTDTSALIR